jgi:hypothetical protein
MTSDHRITSGLIHDILDAPERHGYYRSDDQHTGRAIGLIGDLACIYEGTQDYPAGARLVMMPSSLPAYPGHSGQAHADAVTLTGGDIGTVLAALDTAADHKRDRAETCADCTDQSCLTCCQSRLRDAQAYDRLTTQILRTAEPRAAHCGQPGPASLAARPGQADPAAAIEAGQ